MNDRFTFRIWSKERQKYEHPSYVEETSLFVLARLSEERYTVEQCTGLKDKNRELIYEGDIVRTDEDGYGHIRWDNELAQFFIATEEYYTFDNIFPSEMEVIGNIHENPELLEDK